MLSPLKPLLCRHEFYWSERHQSDRCHRCGKTRAAAEPVHENAPASTLPEALQREPEASVLLDSYVQPEPLENGSFDIPALEASPLPDFAPVARTPSDKVLKAQAQDRRENLLALLDRIADGGQPSRKDCLDVILAVIEDAHSSNPVLFGEDAAGHFARLHQARGGLIF
jgi:hypothetical protein